MTVTAITDARNNAELIVAAHDLGYLRDDDHTLDPTFGLGRFWKLWAPTRLVRTDLDPTKSPDAPMGRDFTRTGFPTGTFDAVVFDPPYKLNGTTSCPSDQHYGVATRSSWQDRHQLIRDGITEAVRVLRPGGVLLVKCQDQVVSGKKRWQTREFATHAETLGCALVDQLHLVAYRPQPPGRRQVHAHQNYSTLLVLQAPAAGSLPGLLGQEEEG